jgi:hypothetical protein
MAAKNDRQFPVDGFYYATSRDLKIWGDPKLLLAGPTIHRIPCDGSTAIAYPSLLDERAKSRNFEDVGTEAWLYYTRIATDRCETRARVLVRQRVVLSPSRSANRGTAP